MLDELVAFDLGDTLVHERSGVPGARAVRQGLQAKLRLALIANRRGVTHRLEGSASRDARGGWRVRSLASGDGNGKRLQPTPIPARGSVW